MKLTILGSGSYLPSLKRHCSAYLLETEGEKIAFDFGRGAVDQLLKLGVDYKNLDRIFISHTHPDHTSDLIPFIEIMLHAHSDFGLRTKTLYIYGPKGFKQFYKNITKVYYSLEIKPDLSFKVIFKELGDTKIKLPNLKITSFKVNHNENLNSLAFRIEDEKKSVFYSGDVSTDENNFKGLKNVDLSVIESTRSVPVKGHLSVAEAAMIASKHGAKKLVLTHISDLLFKNFDILGEAKKYFPGEVIVAQDMMETKI